MVKNRAALIYILPASPLKFKMVQTTESGCYTWKKEFYFMGEILEVKFYLNMENGDLLVRVAGSPRKGKSNFIQELFWEPSKGNVFIEPVKNRTSISVCFTERMMGGGNHV